MLELVKVYLNDELVIQIVGNFFCPLTWAVFQPHFYFCLVRFYYCIQKDNLQNIQLNIKKVHKSITHNEEKKTRRL